MVINYKSKGNEKGRIKLPFLIYGYYEKTKPYKDKSGYLRYKDSNKPHHVAVLEKLFGHKLSKGSVVHHKNRDKTDNRPSNLTVYKNQKAHDSAHRKDKKRFGFW